MSPLARRLRWLLPTLVAVAWLAAAGPLNAVGARLTSLQENDNAAFLPDSAESTRVAELQQRFQGEQSLPLIIVWERPEGIDAQTHRPSPPAEPSSGTILEEEDRLAGPVSPPIPSEDGQALQVIAPLRTDLGEDIVTTVEEVRGHPGARHDRLCDRPGRGVRRLRQRLRRHRRAAAGSRLRHRAGDPAGRLPQPHPAPWSSGPPRWP